MLTNEQYLEAVEKKVFRACIDEKDGAGNLRFNTEAQCIIKRFLPEIVEAVSSVNSDTIDPYFDEIRRKVCTQCEYLKPDGNCDVKERADCCLDRYLVLIVRAIEEAEQEYRTGNTGN